MKTPLPPEQETSVEVVQADASRRRFLQSAAGVAGGLALGLQVALADETAAQPKASPAEVVVPIPEKVFAKVGGADIVETANDKIIVVRTGAASIAACSAVCTHRGCTVGYEADSQELVCPCHGARYSLDGKVKQGPARKALKPYNARMLLGLSEKPTA
jgi:Rieske Fe-S protein